MNCRPHDSTTLNTNVGIDIYTRFGRFRETTEEMMRAEFTGGNIPSNDATECPVCFEREYKVPRGEYWLIIA